MQKNKVKCEDKDGRKIWFLNRYGVRTIRSRVTICLIATALAFTLILLAVYVVIPGIIDNISDNIDDSIAVKMFDSTESTAASAPTVSPEQSAEPAFVQKTPEPTLTPLVPRSEFKNALAENPEIIGRINIESLGIKYLVAQSDDNKRYLKTGYNGKASHIGAIFLDYRCDAKTEPLKGNLILYGHNMKSGKMFHKLMKFKDKDFFKKNRLIRFDTLYRDYTWEIFSAYVTPVSFNYIQTSFKDDNEWLKFLNTIQDKSMFKTDTVLSADDVVLTLSTCTYEFDNARFVVHARLVKKP